MLQNLLNAFSGSATTAAFSNPAANGVSGVSLGTTFGKVFNNLISSFSSSPGNAGFPQQPGFGGMNSGATQAFMNAQNSVANNPMATLKGQAFAPGAVLINSVSTTPQAAAAPNPALSILGGMGGLSANPLQGFAGQSAANSFNSPGGIQGNFGNPQIPAQGQFPFFQSGQQQGPLGKLQFFLSPLIGIFTVVKSLFQLKGIKSGFTPIQVNKNDIGYNNYQGYLTDAYQPGSFDEPDGYEGKGFANSPDQAGYF